VHRAVEQIPYVQRDVEGEVRDRLRAGQPVLLVGSSMVGKTRMAVHPWRLNSGVPATEVAAWAGHSVEVLMRVYARCMTGLEGVWIARMNQALHLEDPATTGAGEGDPE